MTLKEYIESTSTGIIPEVIEIDYEYVKGMSYSTLKAGVYSALGLNVIDKKPTISIINFDKCNEIPTISINEAFELDYDIPCKFDCVVRSINTSYVQEFESITYQCRKCGNELQPFTVEHNCYDLPAGVRCSGCGNHTTRELSCIDEKSNQIDVKYASLSDIESKLVIIGKFLRGIDVSINPGNKLTVLAVPSFNYSNKDKSTINRYFHIIGVVNHDSIFGDISISEEDIHKMKVESSKPTFLRDMLTSIFPYIARMDGIKLPLLLSSIGGVHSNGRRGISHTIIVGDPGTGKSEIVNAMLKVLPKSGSASGGSSASGVGLTCACVPSSISNGYDLVYGLLPLNNNGHVFIDEISRLRESDKNAFHNALENCIIQVNKGGFNGNVDCKTTVFACANPESNVFNPDLPVPEQIGIEPSLYSRFDHRLIVLNESTRESNSLIAMMGMRKRNNSVQCVYDNDFISKFIMYVRNTEVSCEDYIVMYLSDCMFGLGIKTNRDLVGVLRIAESYARLFMHDKVEPLDAVRTMFTIKYEREPITISRESDSLCIDSVSITMLKEYVKVLLTKEPMELIKLSDMLREVHGTDVIDINALLLEMVDEKTIANDNGIVRLL